MQEKFSNDTLKRFSEYLDYHISKKQNQTPKRPEYIILDLTHRCNLKCVMCDIYQDKESFKHDLNTEQIKKVIREAKEWGLNEVIFSGGEALIRRDIFELVDYVKELDYVVGIITNGIISNTQFERIKPYLISGHVALAISLDGVTSQTHDKIRGLKGTHKNVTELFRKLKELKEKHHRVNYSAISVIMNQNLEELPKLAEYLKNIGVSEIQFQALIENNLVLKERKLKDVMWVPHERMPLLDKTIDQLIEFKKNNPDLVYNKIEEFELIKKYFRKELKPTDIVCYQNFKTMLMSSDGRVTTCYNVTGDTKLSGLKEIWDSESSKKGRELVNKCKSPCLIPCFVDFRLKSIKDIQDKFFKDLKKKNYTLEENKKTLQEALVILEGYEIKLSR